MSIQNFFFLNLINHKSCVQMKIRKKLNKFNIEFKRNLSKILNENYKRES